MKYKFIILGAVIIVIGAFLKTLNVNLIPSFVLGLGSIIFLYGLYISFIKTTQ